MNCWSRPGETQIYVQNYNNVYGKLQDKGKDTGCNEHGKSSCITTRMSLPFLLGCCLVAHYHLPVRLANPACLIQMEHKAEEIQPLGTVRMMLWYLLTWLFPAEPCALRCEQEISEAEKFSHTRNKRRHLRTVPLHMASQQEENFTITCFISPPSLYTHLLKLRI